MVDNYLQQHTLSHNVFNPEENKSQHHVSGSYIGTKLETSSNLELLSVHKATHFHQFKSGLPRAQTPTPGGSQTPGLLQFPAGLTDLCSGGWRRCQGAASSPPASQPAAGVTGRGRPSPEPVALPRQSWGLGHRSPERLLSGCLHPLPGPPPLLL